MPDFLLSVGAALLVVVASLGAAYALSLSSAQKQRHLPPGPKPSLFLGNLLDVPKELPWIVYRDWGRLYGT